VILLPELYRRVSKRILELLRYRFVPVNRILKDSEISWYGVIWHFRHSFPVSKYGENPVYPRFKGFPGMFGWRCDEEIDSY